MKILKVSIAFLFAVVTLTACAKVEKILPKKDGLWNNVSVHQVTKVDGSVTQDTTMTDSLGSMMFTETQAIMMDAKGNNTDTMNWTATNEAITFTNPDDPSDSIVVNVVEYSGKEMTTSWSWADSILGSYMEISQTSMMERQ